MVVSSGFAEAGAEGRALQEELRAAAVRTGIPILGPNVEGFVNYVDHVAPYGTTPPPNPVPGVISVISQSGTVAWAMNQLASDRGVGLRIILGVGNEAVLGLGDMFAWAASDPKTKVVTSYIETMRDVEGIGQGLEALRRARKPVLICAPEGRSEAARRSIVAHTGALAGNTALRDAWLRGHGAVLVEDPVTMFEAALLLSHVKRLRTPGVAAALQSGGRLHPLRGSGGIPGPRPTRVRLDHQAEAQAGPAALRLAEQPARRDRTGGRRDRHVRGRDRGARERPRRGPDRVRRVPARGWWARRPGPTRCCARRSSCRRPPGVAFVSVAMSPLAYIPEATAFTREWRLPFLQGHRAACGAIDALIRFQSVERARGAPPCPRIRTRARAMRVLRGRSGPVDEATGAKLLELYGVRRPKEGVAATPSRAGAIARTIALPGGGEGARPGDPAQGAAGRRPARASRNPTDVEVAAAEVLEAAKRAGARGAEGPRAGDGARARRSWSAPSSTIGSAR